VLAGKFVGEDGLDELPLAFWRYRNAQPILEISAGRRRIMVVVIMRPDSSGGAKRPHGQVVAP
jgi:hypothetical protein